MPTVTYRNERLNHNSYKRGELVLSCRAYNPIMVRSNYAKFIADRRRKEVSAKTFAQLLTQEDVHRLKGMHVAVEEQSIEERFKEQAAKWRSETMHLSSPTQMMMHPSYQAILGMALEDKPRVIRLLLHDLQQNRSEWFWALSYLTQDNPIKPEDAGRMDRMIAAWVGWGQERHLI